MAILCCSQDSLIMGSDYYETLEECEYVPGCLPMGLGDGTIVRRAIVDKNARIGEMHVSFRVCGCRHCALCAPCLYRFAHILHRVLWCCAAGCHACLGLSMGRGTPADLDALSSSSFLFPGPKSQIINKEGVKEANKEEQGYVIKDGIVVIIKDSIHPAGTII